jgi:hypothetical protein
MKLPNSLHSPVTPTLLRKSILNTLFLDTLNINMGDQISHSY